MIILSALNTGCACLSPYLWLWTFPSQNATSLACANPSDSHGRAQPGGLRTTQVNRNLPLEAFIGCCELAFHSRCFFLGSFTHVHFAYLPIQFTDFATSGSTFAAKLFLTFCLKHIKMEGSGL